MKKYIKLILLFVILLSSYVTVGAYELNTESHIRYMDGMGDGSFNPEGYVKRSEAAQIVYNLLTEKPSVTKSFDDVSDDAWYGEAVNALYSSELINGKYSETAFFPDSLISRAEFVEIICNFYPAYDAGVSFSDITEESAYYDVIATAVHNGWITGAEDNCFYPDRPITRAETAVILNRVLGRTADKEYIKANDRVRVFTDVEPEHWAYYEITEATVEHTHTNNNGEKWTGYIWEKTGLEPGFYMINHYLYYVEPETGQFSVNCGHNGFNFDLRGRYTTGNSELDGYLHQVISSICVNEVKSEKNLEAIYFYVRDNFVYQVRQHVPHGAVGWELKYALPMMKSHYGNCYSWTAVFMYLTRCVGYESVCQSGTTGKTNADHGWTEIEFDGIWYVFDPEMENSSRNAGNASYNKRYYKLPYNNSIRKYTKYN